MSALGAAGEVGRVQSVTARLGKVASETLSVRRVRDVHFNRRGFREKNLEYGSCGGQARGNSRREYGPQLRKREK